MLIDKLLDVIVPLDFGLASLKGKTRRTVRILISAAVMSLVALTAVASTFRLCPPDASGWFVGIMVVWRIFLHTIAYYAAVVLVMALQGRLKAGIREGDEDHVKASDPMREPPEKENTFFYTNVEEEALVEFIRSNPSRFTSGEDMAIFYLIMTGRRGAGRDMKKFHAFLSPLVDCKSYAQLVSSCARAKEVIEYNKYDKTRIRFMKKYSDMQEILQEFIQEN